MRASNVLAVCVFLGLVSCFNPPEYPITPSIEFETITFKDVPDNATTPNGGFIPDSLVLEVSFKDGDGDIGLSGDADGDDIAYEERFYFKVNDNRKYALRNGATTLDIANDPTFVKYRTRRTNPNYDTLPTIADSYLECIHWDIVKRAGTGTAPTITLDTLYFQLNPNHYNIFIDFLIKQNNGSWVEYDFRKELCTTFDGRIPILAKDDDQSVPLQGKIRYAIQGSGFKFVFGNSTLKLRVRIQDRALNKSNEIETPEFRLSDITR